jgi:hypothetical protein
MGCLYPLYMPALFCAFAASCFQPKSAETGKNKPLQEFTIIFDMSDTATLRRIPLAPAFFADREIIAQMNVTEVHNPNHIAFHFDTRFEGITRAGRRVSAPLGYYALFPPDQPANYLLPLGKSCAKAAANLDEVCETGALVIELLPTVPDIPLRGVWVKVQVYAAVNGR